MILKDLNNKKIGILGLGIENYALVLWLLKQKIKIEINICDMRDKAKLDEKYSFLKKYKNIKWRLGLDFNKGLNNFDILFRSPGWSLNCPGIKEAIKIKKLKDAKIKKFVYSPMRLFFDLSPTKNIVGVTGTKGKGTVSSLISEILKLGFKKEADKKVFLGGNIGVAPFGFIDEVKPNDWIILELSSFQLEDMHKSPHIAVITNFSKEHLASSDPSNPNCHKDMQAYWEAKANIFKFQKEGEALVINYKLKSKVKNHLSSEYKQRSKIYFFKKSELKSSIIGEHNKENIAAAEVVAQLANINNLDIAQAVKNFVGLEYRTQFILERESIKYYNDSFATTPEAAITALKCFSEPVVLMAGGADKGSDFDEMAKEIKNRVKFLILFEGEGSKKIEKELLQIKFPQDNIRYANDMPEAVAMARKNSERGDIVLLSTGCASFGVFKNYKERGKLFTEEVNK